MMTRAGLIGTLALCLVAIVKAQPLFNCNVAHGNSELCRRAGFQGCIWTESTGHCAKSQSCGDHLGVATCTRDWSCRWWNEQCQATIPGDITTTTADTICAEVNSDQSIPFFRRMQTCLKKPQCDWDAASLQCKTDRNYYAFSPSITQGRCEQDGAAVWHQSREGCYDPEHPGMQHDAAHADHVICPPGSCSPRGRCDPNTVCNARSSAACNALFGNCLWDIAGGRCKAKPSPETGLYLQRWCHDASTYSQLYEALRFSDIGPRICPPSTTGAGHNAANCTIKSDCLSKGTLCTYDADVDACSPSPQVVCSQTKCASVCNSRRAVCQWNSARHHCEVYGTWHPASGEDDNNDETETAPNTGTGGSEHSSSSGSHGPAPPSPAPVKPTKRLVFHDWHFHRASGEVTGDVYVPLQSSCRDAKTPFFAVGNSTDGPDANWNCSSIAGPPPHVPTYIPCDERYQAYLERQVHLHRDFILANQTVFEPLNPWGIARAVDIVPATKDEPQDFIRFMLRFNLHNHTLSDACISPVDSLVDKSHISVGSASVVRFLLPVTYTLLDRQGQQTSTVFTVHTLLYRNNDVVQFLDTTRPADPLELVVRFGLTQVGFTSDATFTCKLRSRQAVQIVYALEVHNVPEGTTVGPRFVEDIAVIARCYGVYVARLVPFGCTAGTCLFHIVLRTECRPTDRNDTSNWATCHPHQALANNNTNTTVTASSLEVDFHVQLWRCIGRLPLWQFTGSFENDAALCSPVTSHYAHSSIGMGADMSWTQAPRRFDINMALLRSATSPITDILLELNNKDGTGLPVPSHVLVTERVFNVAVFLDNPMLRQAVNLSINASTIEIIGVDYKGDDVIGRRLTLRDLLPVMTVYPKEVLGSSAAALRHQLAACRPFPGCDGFVVPTWQLRTQLPANSVYFRVALSTTLAPVSTANSTNSTSGDGTGAATTGRRLLQFDGDADDTDYVIIDDIVTINNVTIETEVIIDGDLTLIDIEIINGTSIIDTLIVIDTSALEATERKVRSDTVLLIVFFVFLGVALVAVCIFAAYFWWGRPAAANSAPFMLNSTQQPQSVSVLQYVGARGVLPAMQKRRLGHGSYQAVSTVDN